MELEDIFIFVVYLIIFVIFAITIFNIGKRFSPIVRERIFQKTTPEELEHKKKLQSIRDNARRESEIAYEEESAKYKIEEAKRRATSGESKSTTGKSNIDLKNISKSMESFWSSGTTDTNKTKKTNNMFDFAWTKK